MNRRKKKINGKLIIDNFAGGGGASTGIEMATGTSVDIAINHDPEAIRMHKTNHPNTTHYCESVWDVDPEEVCQGNPVALAWFSPDCKHFSKAKGGTPVEKEIRALAWVVVRWASRVRPEVIMLENVEEFQTWGPLRAKRDKKSGRVLVKETGTDQHGKKKGFRVAEPGETIPQKEQFMEPDPKRKGKTFQKFVKALKAIGYEVEFRELVAADYGAPTMRKRFFMIARSDGRPIIWAEPTHAPIGSEFVKTGKRKPYKGAYTQIDFSRPCPSIFDTAEQIKEKYGIRAVRPLAPKTMERIARGLKKFVLDNAEPFIVQVNHSGSKSVEDPLTTIVRKNEHCLVEVKTAPYIGNNTTNHPGGSCNAPIHTITTGNQKCLISPSLIQYHTETSDKETRGQNPEKPLMTIDGANRYALVTSFLHKYYDGNYKGAGDTLEKPLPTVTSWDHNSICAVTVLQMNNHNDCKNINEPLPTIVSGGSHFGEVRAFLLKYYGTSDAEDISHPLDTVTTKDRFGLVTVKGVDYQIVDIGLRMLEPRELYGCQGFPEDYIIENDYTGKQYPRNEQVRRCGNAVCPPIPAALVKANLPELCTRKRLPNSGTGYKVEENGQLRFAQ